MPARDAFVQEYGTMVPNPAGPQVLAALGPWTLQNRGGAAMLRTMDKRRYPRVSPGLTADLLDAENRPADDALRLTDISAVGVGIESSQYLAQGQSIGFRLRTRGGRDIEATARVRWAREAGYHYSYGLEIEGLGALGRLRLGSELRPPGLSLLQLADTALEAGAAMMAVYVIGDFIRSDVHRLDLLAFSFPYLCFASALAFAFWMLSARAS